MNTNVAQPKKKSGSWLMTILKAFVAIVVVGAVAIGVIGTFVLDGKYELSRSIAIKAPPESVHKQVGDLNEWPNWLPFVKQDPSVKTTIVKATGVGANQHWTSDNGNGELTFTMDDDQKGVDFDMLFDKKYAAKGTLHYIKDGDTTRVTWHMVGQNNDFLGRWMALAMAPMMGPMFEQGLNDLKDKVEATK